MTTPPQDKHTETTHTPGPWRAVRGEGVQANRWWIRFVHDTGDEARCPALARIVGGNRACSDSATQEANARLIAAAPALLAACEDMLEKIERLYPNDWQGTRATARAALRLAKEGR